MTTKRCPACKGLKKVRGLGFSEHDCKTCLGVGHIIEKVVEERVEEVVEEVPLIDAVFNLFVTSEAAASVALDNDMECQTVNTSDITEIIQAPVVEAKKRLGWPKGKPRGKKRE